MLKLELFFQTSEWRVKFKLESTRSYATNFTLTEIKPNYFDTS